jgi:hypothetical protein
MPKEFDSRDFSRNKLTDDRINYLKDIAGNISHEKLKGEHKIKIDTFDPTTANSAVITSENAPTEKGRYVERALKHLQAINSALGFSPTQPAEFNIDPLHPMAQLPTPQDITLLYMKIYQPLQSYQLKRPY